MILGRLSVSRRILLVLAIAVATPALVSIQLLFDARQSLLEARRAEVKHLDEAAWTLVASYHDLAARGLMTEDAAKEAAKNAVRAMHYDGTNYFFVWDLDGTGVAHGGNPGLEGRNFVSGPDAARSPGIADMVGKLVGIARDQKEGFARYRIPKAGQTTALDKVGYAKLFEPWGWSVGTGAYVADIDAFFWSRAREGALAVVGLMILSGCLSFVLGRDLSRSLGGLTGAVKALTSGDLGVPVPSTDRGDEVGVMARAMRVFKDTAVKAARQGAELQTASARLEAALSNMVQGLCVFDPDGRLAICNQQLGKMLGVGPDAMRPGMTLRDMVQVSFAAGNYPGRDFQDVLAARQAQVERREPVSAVIELGKDRLLSVMQCPMPDGGWVATYEDVTERRAAEAKIVYIARHDALTGLPNRLVLHERIEQALVEAEGGARSALLCLDLDGFKGVNDTLGHPVGDTLLVAVSERLQACVTERDTLARVGGDEFVVVQTGVSRPGDAERLAERIIAAMAAPFRLCGQDVTVSASVGLAFMPDDGRDHATVMQNADIALYRAKAAERGGFCCFEASMHARLQLRRRLEIDMRAGLARGEFELFYQPIVRLADKRAVGFEALIRWRHPERGMVAPNDFIPVAEDIGLIVPLGEWVIRQACKEAASWPGELKVAVNLSPNQFKSRALVSTVTHSLQDAGLAASRLELEVTETLLLQDDEETLTILHDLRSLGVRIALDDFGTGYSSLSYLRSFPFDKVKIDQSFVRDLSHGKTSIHIVRAINDLCLGLGIVTTAEGVETDEQLQRLASERCTEVQGYLFSPPRPAVEISTVLEEIQLMRTSAEKQKSGLDWSRFGSQAA